MTASLASVERAGTASHVSRRCAPVPRPDLDAFRCRVRDIVTTRVTPYLDTWEVTGLPRELFADLGGDGLLALSAAPHYGGREWGLWHEVILLEELAAARASGVGASIVSHAIVCARLLERYGNEEQKEQWLRPMLAGSRVAAIAATEPGAGSDFTGLVCRAVDRGDHWELTGEKKFITNAPIADLLFVLARRTAETNLLGFVLVLVPADSPGCTRASLPTLGLRSSPLGWLAFDRCRVSKRLTIGDPNAGFLYAARQLMTERLLASVGILALASYVLERTIAHLRTRRAYGRTLSALQVVRHTLADLAIDIEVLRSFGERLCASAAGGRLEEREICMLKIRAAELLQRLAGECLQLHGAAGFLDGHWLGRVYRDVRAYSLAGGSSAMLADLVAGYMRL